MKVIIWIDFVLRLTLYFSTFLVIPIVYLLNKTTIIFAKYKILQLDYFSWKIKHKYFKNIYLIYAIEFETISSAVISTFFKKNTF